jgi:hypothetical protein
MPAPMLGRSGWVTGGGGASAPAPFGQPLRTASPADLLRVLLIGDSKSYDAGPAVLAILAAMGATGATEVTALNRLGFGLSRTKYDWRSDWARVVEERRPELVVALFGLWDEAFLARQGDEAYARILDESTALLTAGGAKMMLVGILVSLNRAGELLPSVSPRHSSRRPSDRRRQPALLDLSPVRSPGNRYTA